VGWARELYRHPHSRAKLLQFARAFESATDGCKGETPQLCPGLSAETAMACLQNNMDKLTPSCKDAVVKLAKSALNL